MINWNIVAAIYVIDVIIFAYLFYYFYRGLSTASGEGKNVIRTMAILTGVLFLQELYFGINTLTDPKKLGYMSQYFPSINAIWVFAKGILTIAGATIIYTLMRLKK